MTKVHIISIAVIAIILMAIFGHNPLDAIKKKQQERMTKSLVNRIMKHNDKNFGKASKAPKPPTGVYVGVDTSADKVDTDAPDNVPVNQPYRTQNPTGNNMVGTPRFQGGLPQSQPQQQQPAPATGGDDYYPPTPAGMRPQSVLQPLFHQKDGIPMKDGTTVTFAGPRVYAVDNNGVSRPLKDGQYHPFNDNYVMTVRGGERVIFE